MDLLTHLFWFNGHFLGIEWHIWKVIGWTGNLIFSTRFIVQWYATEKKKQVVIPIAFWWLSLVGATCLFLYALLYQHDSVFIFAYAFTWIPYMRNLVIHYRHEDAKKTCERCEAVCSPLANYCSHCGNPFAGDQNKTGKTVSR